MEILYTRTNNISYIPIEVFDALGVPLSGISLSSIDITVFNLVTGTSNIIHPSSEIGSGIYLLKYTSIGQDVVINVEYDGRVWNEFLICNSDIFAEEGIGSIGLYGLATINGVTTGNIRVRILDNNNVVLRDVMSTLSPQAYPDDATKTYNWNVYLLESGTYKVEFWKSGYASSEYSIVLPSNTYNYFSDLLPV